MKRRCFVARDELSLDEIEIMQNAQKNAQKLNVRVDDESAFSKALMGSKRYLKAQGYLEEAED